MSEEERLAAIADSVEREFLNALWSHFDGWRDKVARDFGTTSYQSELKKLRIDPVYSNFGFDFPGYVFIRLAGRLSVSIGRRLGEIYDKMPRHLASSRFDLTKEQVSEKFNDLEVDISLRYSLLSRKDQSHIKTLLEKYGATGAERGLGIEVRYNFNPNDSARLRKDEDMAEYVRDEGLFPMFLIYSSSSPREDAISRLTRAGWTFLRGNDSSEFTKSLFGIDFVDILRREEIQNEIQLRVQDLMEAVYCSYAFSKFTDDQ